MQGDWNYLNLLTLIARTFTYTGDYDKAKQYLEKTLKIEPGFRWVREVLYPEIISKLGK